jgi:hypothetical protein
MFKKSVLTNASNAKFVIESNEQLPVNSRVIRALWAGVADLYQHDLLNQSMLGIAVQMRHSNIDDVFDRIALVMPFIKSQEYPQGIRAVGKVTVGVVTLAEYLSGRDGTIRAVDDYILDINEPIENFVDAMSRLEQSNAYLAGVIADRLYHEMADIISLSEILINEGYHEESSLFKNIMGRFTTRRR